MVEPRHNTLKDVEGRQPADASAVERQEAGTLAVDRIRLAADGLRSCCCLLHGGLWNCVVFGRMLGAGMGIEG